MLKTQCSWCPSRQTTSLHSEPGSSCWYEAAALVGASWKPCSAPNGPSVESHSVALFVMYHMTHYKQFNNLETNIMWYSKIIQTLLTSLFHHAFRKTCLFNFKQNHAGCACCSTMCSFIITAVCLFQTLQWLSPPVPLEIWGLSLTLTSALQTNTSPIFRFILYNIRNIRPQLCEPNSSCRHSSSLILTTAVLYWQNCQTFSDVPKCRSMCHFCPVNKDRSLHCLYLLV